MQFCGPLLIRTRGVRLFGSGKRRKKFSVFSAEVEHGHVRLPRAMPC